MKKKPRVWKHWAVIGVSGRLLRNLSGQIAIWTHRERAEFDCPDYGYVAQVTIRKIVRRKK